MGADETQIFCCSREGREVVEGKFTEPSLSSRPSRDGKFCRGATQEISQLRSGW
jgi:hypothetical protein